MYVLLITVVVLSIYECCSSHGRRDKYERNVKEYWVDLQTTGKDENENEEMFTDRTIGEGQAVSFDLGLPTADCPESPGGDEETDDEVEEDLDGDDAASSKTSKTRVKVPGKNDVETESLLEARKQVGIYMQVWPQQ